MPEVLLKVRNLHTYFYTYEGVVKALDGVNFDLHRGDSLGLVGETGCGKSVTALSILGLIQWPPGKIVDGTIIFEDENLLEKSEEEMREIRGTKISMIFQDPMTSLNPVYRVGEQMKDIVLLHQKMSKAEAVMRSIEMLKLVGLPDAEKLMGQHIHELSGGMCQRVMIAMKLLHNPKLLIADEPTTALDVTIQAQILRLIKRLQKKTNFSILLITHDLGVIAEVCNKVAVMYAGSLVESGTIENIFEDPRHPYTVGLFNAIPKLSEEVERLAVITGSVPNLINPPPGCRFHPRCPYAKAICRKKKPKSLEIGDEHMVSCFLYG